MTSGKGREGGSWEGSEGSMVNSKIPPYTDLPLHAMAEISFAEIKQAVRQAKFDFSRAATLLDASLSPEEVRLAFAQKRALTTCEKDVLPQIPKANPNIGFEFDAEKEMKVAEAAIARATDKAISQSRASKALTSSKPSSDWSFNKWKAEQETKEAQHQARNSAAFDKALNALGGPTGAPVDLSSLPPAIADAVTARREKELLDRKEKREREAAEREQKELEKQRERLRNRFDVDSEDAKGIDPLANLHLGSPGLELSSPSALMPDHVASAIDMVLDGMDVDETEDPGDNTELGWVLKYLDENPAVQTRIPQTQSSTRMSTKTAEQQPKTQQILPPVPPKKRQQQAGRIVNPYGGRGRGSGRGAGRAGGRGGRGGRGTSVRNDSDDSDDSNDDDDDVWQARRLKIKGKGGSSLEPTPTIEKVSRVVRKPQAKAQALLSPKPEPEPEKEEEEKENIDKLTIIAARKEEAKMRKAKEDEELAAQERERERLEAEAKRQSEEARISYELARVQAEKEARERAIRAATERAEREAEQRRLDNERRDRIIAETEATIRELERQEQEAKEKEKESKDQEQEEVKKPDPVQTAADRQASICKAIESQYGSEALFDSDLGFMPPLQAVSCRTTWESLTSNVAREGDVNVENFRVYAFKSDAISDVAEFISDYEGILAGLCMTAQKEGSELSKPSLLSPNTAAEKHVFACLRSTDGNFPAPREGSAVVTAVTGSPGERVHNGIPLTHPLRLFSRPPHFKPYLEKDVGEETRAKMISRCVILPCTSLERKELLKTVLRAPGDNAMHLVSMRFVR